MSLPKIRLVVIVLLIGGVLFNIDRLYLVVKDMPGILDKTSVLRYEEKSNEPVVYSVIGPDVRPLHYEKCDDNTDNNLPLVIEPGEYCIKGINIFVQKGGVRILKVPDYSRYHIVDDGNVINLVSAISWAVTHGNADNQLGLEKLISQARSRKLSLTCSVVSLLARHLLNERGYASRLVLGLTLDDWNTYDNGHTLLEVQGSDKKWILVDLDNNLVFRNNGAYMNALQVFSSVHAGTVEDKLAYIARDSWLDTSGFNDRSGFNYSFYAEKVLYSRSSLVNWYRRVLQVLLIERGGDWFYSGDDPALVKRVSSYSSYRPLPHREFIVKFYGKEYK